MRVGNSGSVGWPAALAHPDLEHGDGLAGERSDSLLPAFPERPQVGPGAELHVGACQADHLGDAQAGLHGGEQQCVVAPAGPGGSVGTVQERFDLFGVQERDGSSIAAFGGDREHSCDQRGVLGMAERAVLKERVDRAEADVAGAGAVAAVGLEMLEERADHRARRVG